MLVDTCSAIYWSWVGAVPVVVVVSGCCAVPYIIAVVVCLIVVVYKVVCECTVSCTVLYSNSESASINCVIG